MDTIPRRILKCFYNDPKALVHCFFVNEIPTLNRTRPKNSGKAFQFMNLRNRVFTGTSFKHAHFSGADLRNAIFIKCDLGHCNMMHCDLRGTVFQHCSLRGESTLFNGSLADTSTQFVSCNIELVDKWVMVSDNNLFKKTLALRRLQGQVTIV
jgi:uncharacterized protein YjbI with pentapeptide repeats